MAESKVQLENLMNVVIKSAQFFLSKNGEFYPFAQVINNDNKVQIVYSLDEEGHPSSKEVLKTLELSLQEKAEDNYLVVAVCTNITVTKSDKVNFSDAINIRLEHRDGLAYNVYLPYKKIDTNKFEYLPIHIESGSHIIFLKN